MSGENLPLVGKLLGHWRHRTTAGYAHLADGHLVEAAEKVGKNHLGIHEDIIAKGNNQIDITRLNVKYRFDTDCLTDKKATQVHFYPRLHCGK